MGTKSFYKVDHSLEEEGAWYTAQDGSRWKLRRINSIQASKAFEKAQKPYAGMLAAANLRNERIPRKIDQEIIRNALIGGVVVGAEALDDNDEKMPLTPGPIMIKLFEECPDLATELWQACARIDQYRASLMAEAAKNSAAG